MQYQKLDVELKVEMLEEYKEWAHSMHEISSEHGEMDREDFFMDLCDSLEEDAETAKEEVWQHKRSEGLRSG